MKNLRAEQQHEDGACQNQGHRDRSLLHNEDQQSPALSRTDDRFDAVSVRVVCRAQSWLSCSDYSLQKRELRAAKVCSPDRDRAMSSAEARRGVKIDSTGIR